MNGKRSVGVIYPPLGHGPTQRKRTDYGHPAHRGFARAIDADDFVVPYRRLPKPLRDTLLTDVVSTFAASFPDRDVYVTENDAVLYAAPRIRRQHPESTILHLAAADHLLGRLRVSRPDDTRFQSFKRRSNSRIDNALVQRILTRYCDGAIAVSEFAAERIRSFAGASYPVRVATPYVQPGPYASLAKVDPDLESKVAVTVGEWRDHKGVDMLVEAWPRVRDRHPEAELRVVGRGHPNEYADTLGVTLLGFVESIDTEFANASLYVHPAYIEPFGVSVVEAMRAGVPALVTETTGARSVVSEVDDSMVVPPTPEALAEGISEYFSTDGRRRRSLSGTSREQTDPFTEEEKTREFSRQFDALLAETGPASGAPE